MKIICLGDSLTYGYGVYFGCGWVSLLEKKLNIKTVNCGTNGDTAGYMWERAYRRIIPELAEPGDIAIILGGANDVLMYGAGPKQVNEILKTAQAFSDAGVTPLVGIEPGFAPNPAPFYGYLRFEDIEENFDNFADLLLKECKEKFEAFDLRTLFTDEGGNKKSGLFSDGVHPDESGHALIAEMLSARIRSLCETELP